MCEPVQEKLSAALCVRGSHNPVLHTVVSPFPPVPSLAHLSIRDSTICLLRVNSPFSARHSEKFASTAPMPYAEDLAL